LVEALGAFKCLWPVICDWGEEVAGCQTPDASKKSCKNPCKRIKADFALCTLHFYFNRECTPMAANKTLNMGTV